jgi:hypothetical protein
MIVLVSILSCLAATPSDGPALPGGVAFSCDFEHAADQDYDGWPDGWYRHSSPELPDYLKVHIVRDAPAGSGPPTSDRSLPPNHALLIELDGGGAMISSPLVPISGQFSLLGTCQIRTVGLRHDVAWIELELLDAQGRSLKTYASNPVSGTTGWATVRIGPINALPKDASQAQVHLRVGPREDLADLTGQAWFDDVRLVRLPRMQLSANHPAALYPRAEGIELRCEVSGIQVRQPRVFFELWDAQGQRLAEALVPLQSPPPSKRPRESADEVEGRAVWQPPIQDYGYYTVRAALRADDREETLLDRTQSLAVLRPLTSARDSEFGWSLPRQAPIPLGPLATVLGQAGLGWAKVSVWYEPEETATADRLAWFAEQLSLQGIEVVGVLDEPPPALRSQFREPGRLAAASVFAEPELWQPAVGPIMTRLSLKVRWWQLGDDQDQSFVGYPQVASKVAEIKRHLEQYGQQIHIGINWHWLHAPPRPAGGTVPWSYLCFSAEPPLTAEEIATYLASATPSAAGSEANAAGGSVAGQAGGRSRSGRLRMRLTSSHDPQPWMLLSPLPRGSYDRNTRAEDLVLRMLAAKIHGAAGIIVPQPFDDEVGLMLADGSPGELLLPWRTTAVLVGGSEYLGTLQLPGGTIGHVFARDGRAVLAVWSPQPITEYVFLGEDAEQIDVWGRGQKLALVQRDGRPLQAVSIGPLPTFVTGLSEAAARWQAVVDFENPRLTSVTGREQIVHLRLVNTFPQTVNGELRIDAPRSLGLESRPVRFKIAEGETLRLPLVVTLAPDANSGPQPVRLDFEVAGHHFSVHRTLHVGLDDVRVEASSRLKDGTLLVEQHLTNLSARSLSFQCVLFAPGRRRETRHVFLPAHNRTSIVFALPQGEELLGQKLWLRAEEIGGSRVLNYTLLAER